MPIPAQKYIPLLSAVARYRDPKRPRTPRLLIAEEISDFETLKDDKTFWDRLFVNIQANTERR